MIQRHAGAGVLAQLAGMRIVPVIVIDDLAAARPLADALVAAGLHLPVVAREAGVDAGFDDFDRIHRRAPVLANVKTIGRVPGGVLLVRRRRPRAHARAAGDAAPGLPDRHRQDGGPEPGRDRAVAVLPRRAARLPEINIPERRLAVVGTSGEHKPPDVIDKTLASRRDIWKPPRPRHDIGILSLYSRVARGAADGASIT